MKIEIYIDIKKCVIILNHILGAVGIISLCLFGYHPFLSLFCASITSAMAFGIRHIDRKFEVGIWE